MPERLNEIGFLAAFLALAWSTAAVSQQKLLVDSGVIELPHESYKGVEFQTIFPIPRFDWTQPVDYRDGQLHVRLDVLERPSLRSFYPLFFLHEVSDAGQQLGFVPSYWSGLGFSVVDPGVYANVNDLALIKPRLDDPPPMVLGFPIQGAGGGNSHWSQRDIFPMRVRFTAVIVGKGARFSGWDAVVGPERPRILPLGEPHSFFDTPVDVRITTAAEAAQIRYTLDGSDPTDASPRYDAPFAVEPPTTIRAATFKEGFPRSDVSSTSYVPTPVAAGDAVLFDDEEAGGWRLELATGELAKDAAEQAYEGDVALGVDASFVRLDLHATEPVDPRPYRALRFAFHPGRARLAAPASLRLSVNGTELSLLADPDRPLWRFPNLRLYELNRAALVDLERRSWHIVELPLDFLGAEPIRHIRLEGSLKGRFYLDDLRLLTRAPSPLSASWAHDWPDSVRSGSTLPVRATVHVDGLDPSGEAPRLVADLYDLGGPPAIPLRPSTAGAHVLDTDVIVEPVSGAREIHIRVEQRTPTRLLLAELTTSIVVVPNADEIIVDDGLADGWQLEPLGQAAVDWEQRTVVYQGERALAVTVDGFGLDLTPSVPIAPGGYTFLRFAFHSGDTVSRASVLNVSVNGRDNAAVNLLQSGREVVHLDRRDWQVVEIPVDRLTTEPIERIRIAGALFGTFYLDDIHLVVAQLSSTTAVDDAWQQVSPSATSLEPSFPNPFNASTTIRFSLAAAAEARLEVYDLSGQRVARLLDGPQEAGHHAVRWDGTDAAGREAASGLYFSRLQTDGHMQARKLLLLR